MKDFKDFFTTGRLRYVVFGFGGVFVALLIFHAGFSLGAQRFVPPGHGGFAVRFAAPGIDIALPGGALADGHGAVGVVERVASTSVLLHSRGGATRTVLLVPSTMIRDVQGATSSSALTKGQLIVVLGTPQEDDAITADLIRLLPAPPMGTSTNQYP